MKNSVLKSEVSLSRTCEEIRVKTLLIEDVGDKWPKVTIADSIDISLKTWYGAYRSVQELAKAIVKAQRKMLVKFKRDERYLNHVQKLADAYNNGQVELGK